MQTKLETMVARLERSRKAAGKALWYMVFADALLDLLLVQTTITHDDLQADLEKRLQAADNDLLKVAYEEAIAALNEHRPA